MRVFDYDKLKTAAITLQGNGRILCTYDNNKVQEDFERLVLPKAWDKLASIPDPERAAAHRRIFTKFLSGFFFVLSRKKSIFKPDRSLLLAHPMFSRITGIDNCYKIFCEIGEGLCILNEDQKPFALVTENPDAVKLHFGKIADGAFVECFRKLCQTSLFPFLIVVTAIFKMRRLAPLSTSANAKLCSALTGKKILLIQSHVPLKLLEKNAAIGTKDFADYFFAKHWIPVTKNKESAVLFVLADQGAGAETRAKLKSQIAADGGHVLFESEILRTADIFSACLDALKAWAFACRLLMARFISYGRADILTQTLLRDASSTAVFHNRCQYSVYRHLGHILSPLAGSLCLLIPYEGRANERMSSLALRETASPQIRGYMHYPLSQKHIALIRSPIEDFCYGFEFRIGTFSRANEERLRTWNKWPKDRIFISGFLKSGIPFQKIATRPPPYRKIKVLLLLSMDIGANDNFCQTVAHAFQKTTHLEFEIYLRNHPSLSLDKAALERVFGQTFQESRGDLLHSLQEKDLILYGETGASLECVGFGPSIIYVRDCRYVSSDRVAMPSLVEATCNSSTELARALEKWAKHGSSQGSDGSFDRSYLIENPRPDLLLTEIFQFQ